jgi:hypothetical protein
MSGLQKLLTDLKRDKRRTGLLIGLAVIGAVVAVRQFSGGTPEEADAHNTPSAAQSDPSDPAAGSPAGSANQADASGAESRLVNGETAAPGPPKVFRFAADDSSMAVPRRNPFQVNLESFRPDPDVLPAAKVQQVEVDPLIQRRSEELALIAAAQRLPLQSIMMANPPQAMLDNTVVKVGQTIGPFTVARISAGAVSLRKDGFEVVLKLEKK